MAKTKSFPVKFDLKFLELLKEEERADTPQQALNFLVTFWENNRPAKAGFMEDLKEVTSIAPGPKNAEKKKDNHKNDGQSAPPSGLSGIDLAIWKAEQKKSDA